MGFLVGLQNKIKKSGLLILSVLLFFYFAFYTICGERGLQRYVYLQQELDYAAQIANKYKTEKLKMEEKVRLLSSSSLDLDLLDERARVVLNYAGKDEFVLLDKDEN